MKWPLMTSTCAKYFCAAFIASAFLLPILHAQPRVSLHIERLDFNGNLLKCPDESFIAERHGELYRLGPNGQVERKLLFDRLHPVPEITAYNTWFRELLAPLMDGGFFAVVDIDVADLGIGRVKNRLVRFDRDGRLFWAVDRSYEPINTGLQLPDGSVLFGSGDSQDCALTILKPGNDGFGCVPIIALGSDLVLGSAPALAIQGSNVIAGGSFSFVRQTNGITTITGTAALLRLNADWLIDTSFHPPLCKDVSQLAVQTDGHIIACGRLADAQGVFESETTVFRLNEDGSFDRRIFQTASNDWQSPAFAIEASEGIIVLNSPQSESPPNYPKLWRYYSNGTLKETITMPYALQCCYGNGFDRIEFLADGSFLAHWLGESNDGPSGIYRDHWVGFKADGQLNALFPPSPFDFVNLYLSVTNLVSNRIVYVEQSKDLLLWEQIPTVEVGEGNGVFKFYVKGPVRMAEEPGLYFFRLRQ